MTLFLLTYNYGMNQRFNNPSVGFVQDSRHVYTYTSIKPLVVDVLKTTNIVCVIIFTSIILNYSYLGEIQSYNKYITKCLSGGGELSSVGIFKNLRVVSVAMVINRGRDYIQTCILYEHRSARRKEGILLVVKRNF